jgi:hypothetical protein
MKADKQRRNKGKLDKTIIERKDRGILNDSGEGAIMAPETAVLVDKL